MEAPCKQRQMVRSQGVSGALVCGDRDVDVDAAWRSALARSPRLRAVELLPSPAFPPSFPCQHLPPCHRSKVTTIGRRAPDADEAAPPSPSSTATPVEHVVVGDMADPAATPAAAAALRGAAAVFCALGTTRAAAGSAEAFRRVDLDYVAAAAAAAKQSGGARHFALISAAGASARLPAPTFAPLHPLLYSHCKGAAEDAVKAAGFGSVSIFRPGLLDRGGRARGMERMFARLPFVPSVRVEDLAAVAVADAERALGVGGSGGGGSGGGGSGVRVFEMAAISKAVAAGCRAPE